MISSVIVHIERQVPRAPILQFRDCATLRALNILSVGTASTLSNSMTSDDSADSPAFIVTSVVK